MPALKIHKTPKFSAKYPLTMVARREFILAQTATNSLFSEATIYPTRFTGNLRGLYPANIMFPSWTTSTNFVYVYDVSNKADPVLSRNFTMSGSYVDSRMIGNYVYDIISENAYLLNGTVLLPTVFSGQGASTVAPTNIYYVNTSDSAYMYTTIAALNIENCSGTSSKHNYPYGQRRINIRFPKQHLSN